MRLNLGSNDRREPGFLSVDICEPADVVCDLNRFPWPWDTGSVEYIKAYDVLEHLCTRIAVLNECWRIMKAGAHLHITVPDAAAGSGHWQDPTHTQPYTVNLFKYFCVRPDGSDTLERARFYRHFRAIESAKLGFDVGETARFRPIHIKRSHYQDGPINPQCCAPEPVYKIDALLEAVK